MKILRSIGNGMKETLKWVGIFIGGLIVLGLPHEGLVWLAGGMDEPTGPAFLFFFWPILVVVCLITLTVDFVIRSRFWSDEYEGPPQLGFKRSNWGRPGFLTVTWIVFYFLPIIFNGLSILFKARNWAQLAELFFKYRWASRWLVVMLTIVCLVLFCALVAIGKKLKGKSTKVVMA